MDQTKEGNVKMPKLVFPTWKTLISMLAEDYAKKKNLDPGLVKKMLKSYAEKFDLIKQLIKSEPPIVTMSTVLTSEGEYQTGPDVYEVLETLRRGKISKNEFFAVYDIAEKRYCYVDPDIRNCLGIEPDEFTIEALLGISPGFNLCHPDDSPHKIRWAGIGYLILSLPAFTFRSMEEYFRIAFRIDTSRSSRPDLVQAGEVVFEKCCYLTIKESSPDNVTPRYHIDRCTIYDKSNFNYVRPFFSSDFIQSEYLNALAYLINCELMDIPVKYILMLDEKARNDRNKAVANEINARLKEISNIDFEFQENQIADYFAKSIRDRIAQALNLWRKSKSPIQALTDSDAVEFAKVLGLISMPSYVREMIYRAIDTKL